MKQFIIPWKGLLFVVLFCFAGAACTNGDCVTVKSEDFAALTPKARAELGQQLFLERETLKNNLKEAKRISKRSVCPDGQGNLGFNSFNFMTFVLLVFNAVANINNNLNNNNNNINDNNVNTITQNSNNVASNVNAANQIGVVVLPIPGKRSVHTVKKRLEKKIAGTGL